MDTPPDPPSEPDDPGSPPNEPPARPWSRVWARARRAASGPSSSRPSTTSGWRNVHRSLDDRYLGGVAGGFATALATDALVLRLGLALTAVWFRGAVLVYGLLWLLLPEEGASRSVLGGVRHDRDSRRRAAAIAAVIVGAYTLIPTLRGSGSSEARLGLLLLLVGAVLVTGGRLREGLARVDQGPRSRPGADPGGGAFPRPPPGAAVGATAAPGGESGPLAAGGVAAEPPPRRWLPRPRRPNTVGWLCLWLVVFLGVVALAVDRVSEGSVSPGFVVSLALLVVAVGLLVASVRGGVAVLLPLGVALTPLWLAFALSDVPRYEGDGRVRFAPASVAEVRPRYEHGFGEMQLDLTGVDLRPGQVVEIDLGLTAGSLDVNVPHDVRVAVRGDAGVARVEGEHVWDGASWRMAHGRTYEDRLAVGDLDVELPARAPICDMLEQVPIPEPEPGPAPEPEPGTGPDPTVGPAPGAAPAPEPAPEPRIHWQRVTPDGVPCEPQPPPRRPGVLMLDVTMGAGVLEVDHVESAA